MNSAFAIGRLCDLEAGCARILAMPESKRMIMSLIGMLGSEDIGSAKNACFALSCIASFQQGHSRLLAHPEIDTIVNILSRLLSCTDDELIWFAAMMLRTIGSQKNGCLYLRTQECVKPALAEVLQRQNVKKDTLEEVEDTLALLEKLPKPKPPTLIVESAYSIIINWEVMNPRSGLDVTYQLHQGDDLVYEGYKSSYIANNLTPVTTYSFCVRAYTEGDDGHTSKVVSVQTPESVPSAPQLPRVVAKTTNQIKIMWDPPEQPNGILKAYQVVTRGKTTYLDISENYLILSGLPADTEYTFEIYALTSKGRGEAAILTARTDDLASHAPPKPVLQALGRHEILVQWDHPPRPLGRINSYEVKVNDMVIYSGIERSCIARFLKPNTEYVVTVSAWTSEGRCESLPAKKRTAREIYQSPAKTTKQNHSKRSSNKHKTVPIRKPLYPFDAKSTEVKRAKTAGQLTIPIPESPSKRRPSRTSSSIEGRLRPQTTAGIAQDNIVNKPHAKRLSGRRSSNIKN
ncbi:phosphatidylinositol phosphatase PTPRQ, partial [Exaiptasia diaphana]|uniref:Fibronectin type-III domain-containing protein n=1 Tax=Exaiptasia diaphana TaxID=2652724 RepID=A0A913X9V4_EXADI